LIDTRNTLASSTQRAKRLIRRIAAHENGVLLIILVALVAVISCVTKGMLLRVENVMNVLLQSSTRGMGAMGELFVILTGGIDLSIGGLALMTSIIGASMMTGTTNLPFGPVAVTLLVGAGFGAATGAAVSRIGMPSLIVTLAMWQVANGISFLICQGHTIANLPEGMLFLGSGRVAGMPIPVILFIVVAVIVYLALKHTTYGRSVYAVGGNPVSAFLSGINVRFATFTVYVISGLLAAVAGLIILGRIGCASMAATTGLELDSIAAAVIGGVSLMGGRGNLVGVVIGSIIIGVINNGMNIIGIHAAYQSIVKGAIIFIAVAVDYIRAR